jgi:hypothetical protein
METSTQHDDMTTLLALAEERGLDSESLYGMLALLHTARNLTTLARALGAGVFIAAWRGPRDTTGSPMPKELLNAGHYAFTPRT